MKTLGLAGLLAIAITILSGCTPTWEIPNGISLWLNFEDASGKDLVEGIGYTPDTEYNLTGQVEPELYTLKLFEDGKYIKTFNVSPTYIIPTLSYYKNWSDSDCCYLVFGSNGTTGSRKEFTFLFTCPYIFGDDAEHEIVAYCKRKRLSMYYRCYRLTFDGKEIIPENVSGKATIVID